MMTSRAEYRLLLRQDNADLRLMEKGYRVGLVSKERYEKLLEKKRLIDEEINRLKKTVIGVNQKVQDFLKAHNSTPIKSGITLSELIKRPELDYYKIREIDKDYVDLPEDVQEQVNIQIKYEGYIKRQMQQVEQFKKLEKKYLREDIDYTKIKGLRIEAAQKLQQIKPRSIGQASRISGVSPSDISVLLVYLEQVSRNKNTNQ